MKRKTLFIVIGLLLFVLTLGFDISKSRAYNRQNDQRPTTQTASQQKTQHKSAHTSTPSTAQSKTLIVYFSRSGTNYPNTTIKIGHTKRLALFIAARTHADQYEIVPARAYPQNYQATVDQAEREQQANERPAVKGALPDVSKYDTIFIGYPIWWNEQPMVVRTFMDAVDLDHKTVVPFSTNAGSGWGDSVAILKKTYPHAHLLSGFSIAGTDADGAQKQVDQWLQKLGY